MALAGGTAVVILLALGGAIPLSAQPHTALSETATPPKVDTTGGRGYDVGSAHTRSLRVDMKKQPAPKPKGGRIPPSYVSFAPDPSTLPSGKKKLTFTPLFDKEPRDRMVSLNAGDTRLLVGGGTINRAFSVLLAACGQPVKKFQDLHKRLLVKALAENEGRKDADVRPTQLNNLADVHPMLKVALCRPCMKLKGKDSSGAMGSVFVSIFKTKFPYGKEQNMGMVYVAGPKGDDFKSKADFLDAVHSTASNVMAALCDYNELVRREGQRLGIRRISSARVALFSGGVFRHSEATKKEVAMAVVGGLAEGYRHGPAPRLNFAYDEDVFRTAWVETTAGLEPFAPNSSGAEDEKKGKDDGK